MDKIFPIPSVAELIANCWNESEEALRASIRSKHPDLDEKDITRFFHDELRLSFEKVSNGEEVENAFLNDLNEAFPMYSCEHRHEFGELSSGLIASVTLHSPEAERFTGGDLGLLLTRPNVKFSYRYDKELEVDGFSQGLLCQAKIKRRNGKWGPFSPNQKEILPNHLDYLSLILYQYQDVNRKELLPFGWQLCKGSKFNAIKKWISSDNFPILQESKEIIKLLGGNEIGTNDKAIIEKCICPESRPYMKIDIAWPGKPPEFKVKLRKRVVEKQKQYVYVKA